MRTDASTFPLLGMNVYTYGLFLALGTLVFAGLMWKLSKRDNNQDAALLGTVLGIPLALVLSRALYCVSDSNFYAVSSFKNALQVSSGGLSMFGALAGMLLGLYLAARAMKKSPLNLMDAFAPASLAFIFFARLGESQTSLGISRPLVTGLLKNSFLAYADTYDTYLKTWLVEAAVAAVLCLVLYMLWRKATREGLTFTLWMLLFGATQTILESLRYDGHMRFSFIGLQQVLSAFLFGIAIIVIALACLRQKKEGKMPLILLVMLAVTVFAAVGLEFLIDRSGINKALLYLVYALLMALPTAMAIHLQKRCING